MAVRHGGRCASQPRARPARGGSGKPSGGGAATGGDLADSDGDRSGVR